MNQAGLARTVQDMINKRVGIGWSTTGHSAVDVNIYAFGPGSENLAGNRENSEIGMAIVELLELEMDSVRPGTR
jgi:alkaline phosphatase